MIISILYFFIFLIIFRYSKHLQIEDTPKWTMPFAFVIKIAMGLIFSYVYIYSNKNPDELSDAIRFLNESKQLYSVFFQSKSDFLALFTGIGDNARMIHQYMQNSFIWDAGNFTFINDSRNTIRIHSLIHFISFGEPFVHTIIMCGLSLIGIQQLHKAFAPYSKLNPLLFFLSILLFPSLLFWSSGILKEPLLILGIGLTARALLIKKAKNKRCFFGALGLILLILFKPYILLCLLPSFLFYTVYIYLFKSNLIYTFIFFTILLVFNILIFPSKTKAITVNLSRKQFDLENVGHGGIHVIDNGKNRFYYFKPEDYKNIKIKDGFVQLIKPSKAIVIPDDQSKIPYDTTLNSIVKSWRIHIIMPGTNSYIKTTNINNSTLQLIKNIPEALINTLFRPFPNDNGSFLMYPAMFEVWVLSIFILISVYLKKEIDKKTRGIIISLLLFATLLLLLIGWTTPVLGAIVRFRFPAQLALFLVGAIIINPSKMKKKHE